MSLYGVDILVDEGGKSWISEINGINSGMQGFRNIYGDNRVERKVISMLREKYGKLSVYDSIQAKTKEELKKRRKDREVLKSEKAVLDWVDDWRKDKSSKEKKDIREILDFEKYVGQDSTVINLVNLPLNRRTVNPYKAEQVARNKFFQYRVLKNSAISGDIIPSALVGMGATDENGLEKIISENNCFVIKPINFSLGMGVRKIEKKDAERYLKTRGKLFPPEISWEILFPGKEDNPLRIFAKVVAREFPEIENYFKYKYFSDMAQDGNFEFESGLALIQPFIDSRKSKDSGEYSCIRAIVCNGKFVDAYARISKNPEVNLAKNARAKELSDCEKEKLSAFSETTVKVFEACCEKLDFDLEKQIYLKYAKETGNPEETVAADKERELSRDLENITNVIQKALVK